MEFHELSTIFPTFEGSPEFKALVTNMKEAGFDPQFPILTWQGKIIDGRHRYLASKEAGVDAIFRALPDTATLDEAIVEVTKANMLRRQLSVAERAVVAEKLANMSVGNPEFSNSANSHDRPARSLADAAKDLNVSRNSVTQVRKIKNEAPEVYQKLERGEIKSVNTAFKEAFSKPEPEESPLDKYRIQPSRPVHQPQQTAKGASITLMGVFKAINENFDDDEIIDCIITDLNTISKEKEGMFHDLCRRRAKAVLEQRAMMERLYEKLEEFLNDNPQSRMN